MALSRLVNLSISSLCNLDIEANKFYDRAHRLYDAAILTLCYTQHALRPYIDSEIKFILGILSKFNLSTWGLNSLTNLVYLNINLLSLLFLLILKIRNPLSFVISILNKTSKPPLNVFSNILTYMIHKWLQFTLNIEKSIKLYLSKFNFHKLKLTCSIDRLY